MKKSKAITGESPQYIRPPYGSWSEELECVVPMTVILWDIDPLDWKVQDTRQIVDHVVKAGSGWKYHFIARFL